MLFAKVGTRHTCTSLSAARNVSYTCTAIIIIAIAVYDTFLAALKLPHRRIDRHAHDM